MLLRQSDVINKLNVQMGIAADSEQFEKAANLRDQINAIEIFRSRQKVVSADNIDRDVVGIACEEKNACGLIFKIREGKIIGRYHFYLTRKLKQHDQEVLHSFLQQYYLKTDYIPAEIFIPQKLETLADFEKWLSQKRGSRTRVITPLKGDKKKVVNLAMNNARLLLGELKMQKLKSKESSFAGAVVALKEALNLLKEPKIIEAFDISNIYGSDQVGSMVFFNNAKPNKSNYRRFKIKTVKKIDDFAMIKEVVTRRYRRLLDEKSQLPDLILIDGGKGQLSSAISALEELGLKNQAIIALAKRLNEVFIPGYPEHQNIPKHSAGLKLLQKIRDESHRFALTYHRNLRSKRQVLSELDQIPGIGDRRRKVLLEQFGSIREIKKASLKKLQIVKGIPKPLAKSIYLYFQENSNKKAEKNERTNG